MERQADDVRALRLDEPIEPPSYAHIHANKQDVCNRLSRAIGHLERVQRMVREERDCSSVLIQLAAVRGAISAVSRLLMRDYTEHCVLDSLAGDPDAIEELERVVDRTVFRSAEKK